MQQYLKVTETLEQAMCIIFVHELLFVFTVVCSGVAEGFSLLGPAVPMFKSSHLDGENI